MHAVSRNTAMSECRPSAHLIGESVTRSWLQAVNIETSGPSSSFRPTTLQLDQRMSTPGKIPHPISVSVSVTRTSLRSPSESFLMHVRIYIYIYGGPGSSVGIVTELRAGRSGIESRWGRDFPPV